VGLGLFLLYVLLYAGFMAIVLVRPRVRDLPGEPEWLSLRPFGGVNLAIAYGLGLIAAALVLAAVYVAVCRRLDRKAAR
jgi:uncharacterized membrane protein (DUF485 family)